LINANISVNDFNEKPEWFHWAGETNNQFYMALVTTNLIGRFPPPLSQYPIGKFFSKNLSFPYHDMLNHV
jgi:hypothetical protein